MSDEYRYLLAHAWADLICDQRQSLAVCAICALDPDGDDNDRWLMMRVDIDRAMLGIPSIDG